MLLFFTELCIVSFLPYLGHAYLVESTHLRPCFIFPGITLLFIFLFFSLPVSVLSLLVAKKMSLTPNVQRTTLLINYGISLVVSIGILLCLHN